MLGYIHSEVVIYIFPFNCLTFAFGKIMINLSGNDPVN
jgi:hypothetical protein